MSVHAARSDGFLLLSLPAELLKMVLCELDTLGNLLSLSMTCRYLHTFCSDAKTALRPEFYPYYVAYHRPPNLHLLVVAVARQIADWAIQSQENRDELNERLYMGHDGLLELAGEVTRVTLKDIRAVYTKKQELLDPLCQFFEYMRFPGILENLGPDAVEDPYSEDPVCEDLETALLNFWIYCDLFHHHVDCAMAGPRKAIDMPKPLSLDTRKCFIENCIKVPYDIKLYDVEAIFRSEAFTDLKLHLCTLNTLIDMTRPSIADTQSIRGWSTNKCALFSVVLLNQGEQTLKMLLPGGVDAAVDELQTVMDRVCEVTEEELDDEELVPRYQPDFWYGMERDVMMAIYDADG